MTYLMWSPSAPLLIHNYKASQAPKKPQTWFGYLPLWPEFVPVDETSGQIDWTGVAANVGAGFIIGLREALGGIVSASLVFATSDFAVLSRMFPWGIGMMWYSTAFGTLWYAIFGRMQYAYGTAQDVIGILQAVMAARIAETLVGQGKEDMIPATTIAMICASAVLTGACSFILGKMRLGRFALLFPQPVTTGFLGAIGFVIFRSSLQTSSGVKFEKFYPNNVEEFCEPLRLAQVGLQIMTVIFIRGAPHLLTILVPSQGAQKVLGLLVQLFPLILFHIVVFSAGISMEWMTENGWVYAKQSSGGFSEHWSEYSPHDVDIGALMQCMVEMPPLIMMSILCTTTGALAVSEKFPKGPPGDPSPIEALDFDRELTTVGVSSMLLGLSGGTLTFHTFTSIQLRLDGGTHRISVLCVALFLFGAFISDVPFGHYIPKWFLSALFMNTAIHFLKGALLAYRTLPKFYWRGHRMISMQYMIPLSSVLISMFFAPANAIFFGMVLSIGLFLFVSARQSPVVNVVIGNRVLSRTKMPVWEMRTLNQEGHRIILMYLQGHLFFGSTQKFVSVLNTALASVNIRFCILSFSRVQSVDPSAARHLKTMTEKAKLSGCRIMCCRTNHDVYDALLAAEVITDPDVVLVQHLRGLRWRSKDNAEYLSASEKLHQEDIEERGPAAQPDAFAHETDALEYCDNQIVKEFCYSGENAQNVQPYMWAYRNACTKLARFDERYFEEMNGMRPNLMSELKPHCVVMENIPRWDKVDCGKASLYFILKGSVSLVQMQPQADADDDSQARRSRTGIRSVRGFSFREGKRLQRRYPPGNVVGAQSFFLKQADKVLNPEMSPQIVVSSRFGGSAELWILKWKAWEDLPIHLRSELTEILCKTMADDAQHACLQER